MTVKVRAGKGLADYLRRVFVDLQADDDVVRALRRIHIKEVHLRRRGDSAGVSVLKKTRRLL